MSLNVNVEYVLREQKRLEIERRNITLRIAVWVQRTVALTAFRAALTSEERSHVTWNEQDAEPREVTPEQANAIWLRLRTIQSREATMQNTRRPSARFRGRADEDTRESERAGILAGERDAAELDDLDADDAWLDHIRDGGPNAAARRDSFVAAYEASYERAFTGSEQLPVEQVRDAV